MYKKNITTNTELTTKRSRTAVFVLLGALAVQIGTYGYFVNASVDHVVRRISLERNTGDLISSVSRLESEYFTLQGKVNEETAESLRYVTSSAVQYVDTSGAPITVLTRSN